MVHLEHSVTLCCAHLCNLDIKVWLFTAVYRVVPCQPLHSSEFCARTTRCRRQTPDTGHHSPLTRVTTSNWLPHLFPLPGQGSQGSPRPRPAAACGNLCRCGRRMTPAVWALLWRFWLFWLRLAPMIGLLCPAQRREAEKNSIGLLGNKQATHTIPDVISLIRLPTTTTSNVSPNCRIR